MAAERSRAEGHVPTGLAFITFVRPETQVGTIARCCLSIVVAHNWPIAIGLCRSSSWLTSGRVATAAAESMLRMLTSTVQS